MNRYTIEHDNRRFVVEAENEEQALSMVQAEPVQGMVAGTKEEMQQQRTQNLEQALGLDAPINTERSPKLKDRAWFGIATPGQKKAYVDVEYGPDRFIDLGNNRALIKAPNKDGKDEWFLDDPVGLDWGDVPQVAANAPQLIAGIAAGASRLPGPQGLAAKAFIASGASALASNVVGGLQDAFYRAANDLPVQAGEIAQRRGLSAGLETAIGTVVPMAAGKLAQISAKSEGIGRLLETFKREANEGKDFLIGKGIKAQTVSEVPDAILAANPAKISQHQAGLAVADVANKVDRAITDGSKRLLGSAADDVALRSEAMLSGATAAKPISANDVGNASVGGVKTFVEKAQKDVRDNFDAALKLVDLESGGQKYIVNMRETNSFVKDVLNNRLRDSDGQPIKLGTELVNQLTEIERAAGVGQSLQAVRNLRTQLAAHFRGEPVFPGVSAGTAKQLYKALSTDIDDSLKAIGGKGGAALRIANDQYKKLLKPVEENSLLAKLVNDKFENGTDVIKAYANAGVDDWRALKGYLGGNTYNHLRRSVADDLMVGDKMMIQGKEYANFANLGRRLSGMNNEVKNEIFGSERVWKGLEQLSREQDFIAIKQGMFGSPAMPTKETIIAIGNEMRANGFDAANKQLKRALSAQEARTNNLYGALASQMRNGNFEYAAKDPDAVMGTLLSGKHSGAFVTSILNKMPKDLREQVQRTAMHRVFETAKDRSVSAVSGKQSLYDYRNVIGSGPQKEAARALLGPENFKLVESWAKLALHTQIEANRNAGFIKNAARLIAVVPYMKLFAARATQEAVETAAGKTYLAGLSPQTAALFTEARKNLSVKTAAANALIQKASSHPLWESYNQMHANYSEEKRDAIDGFMLGLY